MTDTSEEFHKFRIINTACFYRSSIFIDHGVTIKTNLQTALDLGRFVVKDDGIPIDRRTSDNNYILRSFIDA